MNVLDWYNALKYDLNIYHKIGHLISCQLSSYFFAKKLIFAYTLINQASISLLDGGWIFSQQNLWSNINSQILRLRMSKYIYWNQLWLIIWIPGNLTNQKFTHWILCRNLCPNTMSIKYRKRCWCKTVFRYCLSYQPI